MKTTINYEEDRIVYEIYHNVITMESYMNILKVKVETPKTLSGIINNVGFRVLKKDLNKVKPIDIYFRAQLEAKNPEDALNKANELFAQAYLEKANKLLKK